MWRDVYLIPKPRFSQLFYCAGPSNPDSQLSVEVLQTVWCHRVTIPTVTLLRIAI